MWLSRYFVLFIIFGCIGWVYETLYCMARTGKWENRGFLYGPILPIYGLGAVLATIVVDLVSGIAVTYTYSWWQVFLVAFFGSIVLEYSTSWGLEKLFHAYWWDYSNMPMNIHGRICFPYSCGFGFAGLLVVYVILPFVEEKTTWISPIQYEFFGLLLMGLISIDTTLTVSALTNFAKRVEAFEKALDDHMEQFVENVKEKKLTPGLLLPDNEEGIAKERERFSRERMEAILNGFGAGSNAALRRVQGFRPARMNSGLSLLKEIKEKRKKG